MKLVIVLVSVMGLLSSCASQNPTTTDNVNCPSPPNNPPAFSVTGEQDFYNNLQSVHSIATEDTITFQTRHYDLIFCRPTQTWSVQQGTYTPPEPPPEDYEQALNRLGDPPYHSLELDGKSYQFRVLLDPNPFPDFQVEPQQVVLELITPDQPEPQRQTLYTLKQVKEQQTGIQLGIPTITASLIYDHRLYWTISPEQGEGNGGIATIASYDPKTNQFDRIQPPKLANQQINDLVIAGEPDQPIFWMATKMSGEGNPYLPGMGLVAYRPQSKDLKSYHRRNSPLIGAVPRELHLDNQALWVGTGNGICQVQWQAIDKADSWQCWQFSLEAQLPETGVEVYPSLLATTPQSNLTPTETQPTVEVLWWASGDPQTDQGRYEVVYPPGFTVSLKDKGAMAWSDLYQNSPRGKEWDAPVYWVGKDWHWSGDRLIRPFDGVLLNSFGGGPSGISTWDTPGRQRPEIYAMRGDLDLIELTNNQTEVKYYSGWVDDSSLSPYLTLVFVEKPKSVQPNPLEAVQKKLDSNQR